MANAIICRQQLQLQLQLQFYCDFLCHRKAGKFFSKRTIRLFSSSSSCSILKSEAKLNSKDSSSILKPKTKLNSKVSSSSSRSVLKSEMKLNSKVSPHRAACAVRLLRIEEGGAFADLLSPTVSPKELDYLYRTLGFRTKPLDSRNTRLVTDIVAGVVRWKLYLDYLIGSLYNGGKRPKSMEPLLRQILRIGIYEIVKMEMPSYAAVNENVTLAKEALRDGAGKLVNGLLRRIALDKERGRLPMAKVEGNEHAKTAALSIMHSHPLWMVKRWFSQLGEDDTIKLMEWNNKPPSFSLRANSGKGISRDDLLALLQRLDVPCTSSPLLTEFVRISSGLQTVIQSGLLKDGICAVQDESAALIVSVVDPKPGETIIDCCAAPGGKTLFMAACLEGKGNVTAIDINKSRLQILEVAVKAQGFNKIVNCFHHDIRSFTVTTDARADKVLLDAPCTGLGVLCKKPDLRWRRTEKDLKELLVLQDELLDAASVLVKPGGILVYSTCSVDPEENQERIKSFLARHPEYKLETVQNYVPPKFVSDEGFFSSHPNRNLLDGAFAARLYHVP